MINATGQVDVDGGDGTGAPSVEGTLGGGGGGGGAGGLIILEAPEIENFRSIDADGGHGGRGAGRYPLPGGVGGSGTREEREARAGVCQNEAGGGGGGARGGVIIRTDPEGFIDVGVEPAPSTSCIHTTLTRVCD